jgi:Bacterial Ig domain
MALDNFNPDKIKEDDVLTPIVEGDDSVVADFFLPGCCTFDDDCNPMCMTEEEMLELAIPPFAKSDYITTTKNTPVNIYAFMNDDPIYGDKVSIDPGMFEMITNKGGRVILANDKSFFTYTPGAGYTGKDRFRYSVYNTVNKLRDTATVFINVIEGDVNVLIQPTISVASSFCGGPDYSSSVDYVPITITPGSFPGSVFTIENENLKPWLIKTAKQTGAGFDYSIDPSLFTATETVTLRLVRDSIATTQTATFTVNVIIADFEYTLSMVAFEDPELEFRKTTNSEPEFFKSRTTVLESEILNEKELLPFDEKSIGRINIPTEDPPVAQDYTIRIDILNKSSANADTFQWELLTNPRSAPLISVMTTDKVESFFWVVPAQSISLGAYIQLTASSSRGGCNSRKILYIRPMPTK